MNLKQALASLPDTEKNVVSILSGGLDSSIMTMLLKAKYGKDRVFALSFDYGQKQKVELEKAAELCTILGVAHKVLDLGILGEIARPFSANISGTDVVMPDIKDVLGDPQPKTYVPNRNMIMYSLAAAYAEVNNADYIFCGLQVHDEYSYHDTTQKWVDKMNSTLSENRKHRIEIISPFSQLSKYQEILLAQELKLAHLLSSTLTCYNPNDKGESCSKCPSCAERIMNFAKVGLKDPIPYSVEIDWDKLVQKYKQS